MIHYKYFSVYNFPRVIYKTSKNVDFLNLLVANVKFLIRNLYAQFTNCFYFFFFILLIFYIFHMHLLKKKAYNMIFIHTAHAAFNHFYNFVATVLRESTKRNLR